MLSRWWARAVLGAISGVMLAVAFPPLGWWPAAVMGVALLTFACLRARLWEGIVAGGVSGLVFFALLMPWLRVIGDEAWLGLSAYCAAWIGLVGAGTAALTRMRAWPVLVPCLWVLEEALRDRLPWGGYPWGRLAFSQSEAPYSWVSRLGGMPLLTFWVASLGVVLLLVLHSIGHSRRRALSGVIALGILLLVGRGLSLYVPAQQGSAVIAVVQGGTPQMGMGAMDVRRQVLDNHVAQTLSLAQDVAAGLVEQPQLVIWPENASDIDPFMDLSAAADIQRAADAVRAPILVGAVAEVPGQPESLWNLGIVWNPVTGPASRYAKSHLVPFGEYIPLREYISSWFADFDRISRDFVPGTKPGLLDAGGLRIGDIICFEVAYDDIARDVLNAGAKLLVVQTNNATYGETSQPDQQLAIERLRAIEASAGVAVAATTGVSALIDREGIPMSRLDSGETGYLVAEMPLVGGRTISTVIGAWPEVLISLVALGGLVSCALTGLRRGRRQGT